MRYVIALARPSSEGCAPLYWDRYQMLWGDFGTATVYDDRTGQLPPNGVFVPWLRWSVLYAVEGAVVQCGPFDSKQAAMQWVDEHRLRGTEQDDDQYEFSLDDTYVHLLGPDHTMVELNNSDFDLPEKAT